MTKRRLVKIGDKKESGSAAQKSTSGTNKSKDASVDNELRTRALKDEDMRKVAVGGSEGEESAVNESGRSKDVPLDDDLKIGALRNEVMRKAASHKPAENSAATAAKQVRKSNDVNVDDDLTMGVLKNDVRGEVDVDKSIGKKVAKQSNTLKDSDVDNDLKLEVLKDKVMRAVSGGKSMGKKSEARESKARGKAKLVEEEQDAETNMMEEGCKKGTPMEEGSKEDTPTPVRRKRGADGEIVEEFWLSLERSSSRLRPRKEVLAFRLVDLEDDDNDRIIGKRVKVYWSGSRKWFTGHIKAFDYEKRLHDILYEDGDREMLDLRKERFELEIMPTECFKLRTKPSYERKVKDLDGEKVSAETLQEDIEMVDAEKGAKESEPEKKTESDISVKEKTDPEVKNGEELVAKMGVDVPLEKAKEMVIDEAHDDDEIDNIKNAVINVNKSVEVNYQEEDGKINSLAEEKGGMSVEAQHRTLDSNVEKKGDDHLEKQSEIVEKSESEDAICMDRNLTGQKAGKAKKAKDNKKA
ncbi:uncharacterized protein LOC121241131 isoform X1 [Juglans microcarpa x Juglans regia]|uniref:uncharacterized protein LOC121241131 isoform X1 n=2 Tax=Juglans microcarpa x Juglans regia TaxID=2249226 RepID=UPI001B7F4311|nr:uncharacterized protein LOC121241131 isoform X1 [Juglans microcarpa x Juglans regia]XP_040994690.1 uncharacterized protein LOC121241131 isoform X1 [Juglans microcarpa x Juglans regia]XP_040994691.1 uncharacterized protein LOC121241131 isoform X1 [Juglans microcarpa x Juglans regia]XP_040994692.1 uncharacterized protein LOC121241131 isoform X1 [Juglans microcarpa x Juglans regia]XP_040994693.1 uncharacterized protein LOC121241131 isoform X1 [Juglans microcarpa x Juglans regia]XP_040994694.1 